MSNVSVGAYPEMFKGYPDVVCVAELREMLGIGRQMAYSLVHDGEIKGIKIGREYKIAKLSIIEYVLQNVAGKQTADLRHALGI
ncbi:MAG: helix-turn-helix domain-containing protein [Firmicutes bacterium]|nr:helix-turn-helix domain-containing protein [Bacillota bacterium]